MSNNTLNIKRRRFEVTQFDRERGFKIINGKRYNLGWVRCAQIEVAGMPDFKDEMG